MLLIGFIYIACWKVLTTQRPQRPIIPVIMKTRKDNDPTVWVLYEMKEDNSAVNVSGPSRG